MKNDSKKRPKNEKKEVPATMGRGCVALKETPEPTGQRQGTRSQTRWEARYQKPDMQRPQARSQKPDTRQPDNLRKLRSSEAQIYRNPEAHISLT